MIKKYNIHKKQGFTLVDTLIGVVIFFIALLAAMAMLKYTSSLYSLQNEDSIANSVLNYVAEDIKATSDSDYYHADLSPGNHSADFTTGAKKPSELDKLNNGAISVIVTEPETYLKKITITLTWDSTAGSSQSQTVVIYITDPVII